MSEKNFEVPLWEKYVLTIDEAIVYFNIGEKKLRKIVSEHISDNSFVILSGNKQLIKRKKFEEFLDRTNAI